MQNGELLLTNNFDSLPKEELLDRYDSHTRHCKKCQRSLAVVRAMKTIATVLSCGCIAFAAFTARLASTGMEYSKLSFFGGLMGALLFAFVQQKLSLFESLYYFDDYEHWKT